MQDQEFIQEQQINKVATEKIRKDAKYQRFLTWLKDNGALIDERLAYPTAFGPNACIGVSCSQRLEPYKAIIAIPRKIIIDTDKIKQIPQFAAIIQQNPRMFTSRDQTDAAFNTLSLFLISQHLKGNKSFYWPYFQVCECKNLLMDWNRAELQQLENRDIAQQIQQYKEDAELQFMNFLRVIRKYDKVFPSDIKNEAYKRMFEWAHEFVMTRAFGWSVPSASLIPFADMLNHGEPHLDHFITDVEREACIEVVSKKNEQQSQNQTSDDYIQKKKRCNLNIFKKEYLQPSSEQLQRFREGKLSARRKYIMKHQKLVDGDATKVQQNKAINHILYQQYDSGVHTLRQLYFAESSCSEDNDTDQDEREDFQTKVELFRKDDKAILKGSVKTPLKTSVKRYWEIFGQEKAKTKRQKKKVPEKVNEEQQAEQEEVSQKSLKSESIQSSESEQQEQWNWLNTSKQQSVHFVLFTTRPYNKNEQIHNFYGRRTNRFLLLGYNFATLTNKYDSFSFRMAIDPLSLVKPVISKIVYSKQLNLKDRQNAVITKDIRVKSQKICIELIDHCRCILLPTINKDQQSLVPITIPTSIALEQSTLALAKDILKYQLSHFYTDAQEDEETIGKGSVGPRLYTAAVIRLAYKRIIKQQVKMLDKSIEFLGRWKKGKLQLQEKQMGEVRRVKEYLCELERSSI